MVALQADLAAEVERLAALAASALGSGAGMEAVERAIRAAVTGLGGALLEGLLAADAGHCGPRVDCGAGHQAEFVSYRAKTITTVLGPVRFRRAWYHCRHCGHGLAPGDGQLGVAGASMSPGLRKMTARAAAAVPFAGAAALLRELAGVELTAKRAERSAEADGRAAAALIAGQASAILARRIVPLPPADPPDKLYLAIDGTGVPMTAAETEGRPGKHEDGRARTREVKMACLFTQTRVDEDGYPVRDPGSASYLATFGNAAQLGDLAEAEARRRGSEHIRQLTILGDGAAWIWNQASQHFPAATQIVDLYHAREHLHALGSLVAFMLGTSYKDWLAVASPGVGAGCNNDRNEDPAHQRLARRQSAQGPRPVRGARSRAAQPYPDRARRGRRPSAGRGGSVRDGDAEP